MDMDSNSNTVVVTQPENDGKKLDMVEEFETPESLIKKSQNNNSRLLEVFYQGRTGERWNRKS